MNLKDKIVVIIGGSQGLGKALAVGFIDEGSLVAIVSRNVDSINKSAKEIGATPFVADVRNEKDLRLVAELVIAKFGKIDVWINSAGVFKIFSKDDLLDMGRAHELMDVNFFGTVLGCKTAISFMKDEGVVINILSSAALDATRAVNAELYAASKWAVRGFVDALRGTNKTGIKFYSIYPGGIKTHLHDEALPSNFGDFMNAEYVVKKIITNLKQDIPESDLIIKRPI